MAGVPPKGLGPHPCGQHRSTAGFNKSVKKRQGGRCESSSMESLCCEIRMSLSKAPSNEIRTWRFGLCVYDPHTSPLWPYANHLCHKGVTSAYIYIYTYMNRYIYIYISACVCVYQPRPWFQQAGKGDSPLGAIGQVSTSKQTSQAQWQE